MEQPERVNVNEHVIDIRSSVEVASSSSHVHDRVDNQPVPSSNARAAISQSSFPISNVSASENSDAQRRRRESLLVFRLRLVGDLSLSLSQIVASVIVLSLSGHEHPQTPLFEWIVSYAAGCVAILPLYYWQYLQRNLASEQVSVQSRQSSSNGSTTAQSQEGDNRTAGSSSQSASVLSAALHNARLKASAEYFRRGLDWFFAIWFVVGILLIFDGHTSVASEAPNLYR